jgi:hypothetical protein
MKLIAWVAAALASAWLWDRCWLRLGLPERFRVGIAVPVGEELLKYAVAAWGGLFLPLVSVLFGLGEGLYETARFRERRAGLLLGAGLLTHAVFGAVYLLPFPAFWLLPAAIAVHIGWNCRVLWNKEP